MSNHGFYEELNKSLLPDMAFGQWQDYRQAITEFILENIEFNQSVLIIGAGNCNDIDLKKLSEKYAVTLSDIDGAAMDQGCKRQAVSLLSKSMDYLQLEATDWKNKLEALLPVYNPLSYAEILAEVKAAANGSDKTHHLGNFDAVVVLPIYTQLFYREAESVLSVALMTDLISEQAYSEAQRMLLDLMPEIIKSFNKWLVEQVKEGGQILVFSDYLEDTEVGAYTAKFQPFSFEAVYQSYYEKYGMGLGHYGVYDLGTRATACQEGWFIWSFDEVRRLFVKGVAFNR